LQETRPSLRARPALRLCASMGAACVRKMCFRARLRYISCLHCALFRQIYLSMYLKCSANQCPARPFRGSEHSLRRGCCLQSKPPCALYEGAHCALHRQGEKESLRGEGVGERLQRSALFLSALRMSMHSCLRAPHRDITQRQ